MMTYTYEYPKVDHTVDGVVLSLNQSLQGLRILLVRRADPPFQSAWALPGGFVHENELLTESLLRKVLEDTGLVCDSYFEQLYTFDALDRDPRGRVLSTAFIVLRRREDRPTPGPGILECRWFDLDDLPPLAFDHGDIIRKALSRLQSKVRWTPISVELLPSEGFTLNEIQKVYETLLGRKWLDRRNFRRKILSYNVLEPTEGRRGVGRGPEACLYQFKRDRYQAMVDGGGYFEV